MFAFTAPAIKLAFEDTGLVPFNPEKIKSLAAEHHHMEDLALGKCLSDAKARQQQYVDDIVASALPKMIERSKRRRKPVMRVKLGGEDLNGESLRSILRDHHDNNREQKEKKEKAQRKKERASEARKRKRQQDKEEK